jgi:hypothetical protein
MSGWLAAQFAALGGGDPAALCTQTYDACKQSSGSSSSGTCTPPSATCMATVGEIEQCLTDSFGALSETMALFPQCDSLDQFDPNSLQTANPASCQVVQEKCPDALANTPTGALGNLGEGGAGGSGGSAGSANGGTPSL